MRFLKFTFVFMAFLPLLCSSAAQYTVDTAITSVAINGGQDTTNPGTTCILVSKPVSASCQAGYIAIINNNKQLIAAALIAKTSNSKVAVIYEDAGSGYHCPGHVYTSCAVINIELN